MQIFLEKLSVFPFDLVKFRPATSFLPLLLPFFYFYIYNFYLFPFLEHKIRSYSTYERILFAFFIFPHIAPGGVRPCAVFSYVHHTDRLFWRLDFGF